MSFKSFLQAVGHDFKVIGQDIEKAMPYVMTIGEAAVKQFFPFASPLFNSTASAIIMAEQAYPNVSGAKTGLQKSAAVLGMIGPLIKQGLADIGKPNDDAAAQKYIDSVVTVLDSFPAPPTTTA
jgi:hypothetical protein